MKPYLDRIREEGVDRILIIRRRGLGDALVNLPAIRQVQTSFPGADIDLLIDRPFVAAIRLVLPDMRTLSWPPDKSRILGRSAVWDRIRGYDLVLDFLSTPATAMLTALSGARWRIGYDLRGRRWAYNIRVPRNLRQASRLSQFAGESFLDPLRVLGMDVPPWQPLPPGGTGSIQVDPRIGDWWRGIQVAGAVHVSLVMSASWSAKAWPAEEAVYLMRILKEVGWVPILIPGPGDREYTSRVQAMDSRLIIAPPTDLLELAFLVRSVDVHIGTDNGSRHLAAAQGTRTVTIFGSTDMRGWNPEDPRHVSVGRDLDCSPCDLQVCPRPGHPCLQDLPARKVAAAAIDLVGRTNGRGILEDD